MNREKMIRDIETTFQTVIQNIGYEVKNFSWEDREAYCHWLAQTYYMVEHTTRFLCFTASQFEIEYKEFHQFCLHHLKEEAGHEMLAKKDLEILGHSLKNLPATFETQFMIQSQYYWIQKTPFAHFGFFWVLEKLSVEYGADAIRRVHKAHGNRCTAFLKLHAEEDVGHVQEIFDRVKKFPDAQLPSLEKNIAQTGWAYCQMLRSLKSKSLKKVA